jgi:cation transport regulator ChaC
MPRGGFRAGAGRPRTSDRVEPKLTPSDGHAAKMEGLTPLEYMLLVMNDPSVPEVRRDRMAVSAAPYVHPKANEEVVGKKRAAEIAAETAGQGSDWGSDLQVADF